MEKLPAKKFNGVVFTQMTAIFQGVQKTDFKERAGDNTKM